MEYVPIFATRFKFNIKKTAAATMNNNPMRRLVFGVNVLLSL